MRDAVRVLRYTCWYRGSIVDRRNLKQIAGRPLSTSERDI